MMRLKIFLCAALIVGMVSAAWAKTDDAVREGVGWRDATVGKTAEQITKSFGTAETITSDATGTWYSYRRRHGLDFWFGHSSADAQLSGVVTEVRFNSEFAGRSRLGSGIGISSSLVDVEKAYGRVRETRSLPDISAAGDRASRVLYRSPKAAKLIYGDRGVLFWFGPDDHVTQFVVFAPETADPPSAGQ